MYWGLALSVGLVCLASQYALQSLLASTVLGDGWWRREPVFLAHQIIAARGRDPCHGSLLESAGHAG